MWTYLNERGLKQVPACRSTVFPSTGILYLFGAKQGDSSGVQLA